MSTDTPATTRRGLRMVAAALVATTSGTLPVFLLGGLAVQIAADLGFGAARLGAMATVFFATSAVSSTPAGRLAERLGTYRALLLASTLSAFALLGAATIGRSWGLLVACLAAGGVANGVAQPAANLLLARGIPASRQGLAFGIKQAAVPAASFLGGVAVPVLGLTAGWRWAFGLGVLGPLTVVLITPRLQAAPKQRGGRLRAGDSPTHALIAIAAAAGFGTAAATTLGTFLVSASVDRGVAPSQAGLLLAFGSVVGVASRVLVGWRADLGQGRHLRAVRRMLLAGAFGFAILATAHASALLVVGTLLGFGAGWGWNGLLVYAVVRTNPNAPAAATGVTQTGLYLGGVLGPILFGVVSERWTFGAGWWLGAVLLLVAWLCALIGERAIAASPSGAPAA